ncbi:hypothetical protein [Pedobacter deserti]|uniref:hypothetical protein n=1 Tax=Pedobacter deserti TaxID=2817382 RepID=UPI00210A47AA|nr:hypothetical protein [Pedobacter sp. SYSU D00382]
MMPISTWTATALKELKNNQPIIERTACDYTFQIFSCYDSLWAIVLRSSGHGTAFRMAFSSGSQLRLSAMQDSGHQIQFTLNADDASNCVIYYRLRTILDPSN